MENKILHCRRLKFMAFWGIFEQYVGTIIILAWPPKLYDLQGGHVYIFKKKSTHTVSPPFRPLRFRWLDHSPPLVLVSPPLVKGAAR